MLSFYGALIFVFRLHWCSSLHRHNNDALQVQKLPTTSCLSLYQYREQWYFLSIWQKKTLMWMFLHIKLLQMFVISPPRIQAWFQRRRTSFSHSVITEEWKHLCNHFWTVILDKHPDQRAQIPPLFFFLSQHFVFQLLAKFTPWNLRNTITLAS